MAEQNMRRVVSLRASMLFLLYIGIMLVMFSPLIDIRAGKPLTERVVVKGREFEAKPVQISNGIRHLLPPAYRFHVANERGKGWVTVTQEFYEATADGDTITVTGKRGLLSGYWYLKEAHKEM
ncbi:hypothetical protein IAD21_01343 [Abditibacteriota bacterium]|nr:hypothetical protein IAD21_01343 [Abditibacteriota bacterium]